MPNDAIQPGAAGGAAGRAAPPIRAAAAGLESVGQRTLDVFEHIGAVCALLGQMLRWLWRWAWHRRVRIGWPAIVSQYVRIGVRSLFIISLVSGCVGLILVLQMAPPLDDFGQKELVANITGVAVFRELGPLIAAIVLTGFAGAAIAAEIGTMVVGEEIEALEAHALNPVRFLVIPRVLAAVVSMTCLAVISDLVAVFSGMLTASLALGIPSEKYLQNMQEQLKLVDFVTGIGKATVFGLLIGLIACTNGLKVTGGAAGVGKATTGTVVQSVVAIIIADLIFTAIFYALKLT
jgi:phospholipid/cholesterol/gamma-HCH transport system permease protein